MVSLDEVLAAMPDEASVTYEELTIDAEKRRILVPEAEEIFGVEADEVAERKYFRCPRYVGDNLDLAGMFLTVYFRNANGDEDGYLVDDVAVDGDDITFSWLLSEKVTAYKGAVQFSVCADLPNTETKRRPDWNTTLAAGTVLEGLDPDVGDVEAGSSDVLTQLRETVQAQTAAVEAVGAAQIDAVEEAGANATQEAKDAVAAQGAATLATIPEDYTALANTVDKLTRDRAAAIVCEAEGEAVQVQDASNDPLIGLRIFGRSTQNGTPTPDAPVEIVSLPAPVVTVSDGSGGNVQTLTVTTPDGLPGIPVDSGGNYTDANGQQWVADEVDLARGVYVQRVTPYTVTGAEDWYLSAVQTGDTMRFDVNLSLEPGAGAVNAVCAYFPNAGANVAGVWCLVNEVHLALRVKWHYATLEEFKAFLAERYAANEPVVVYYALATPIEHALTEAELLAFRALHSVKPVTTVLNDAGAHMALEYAADPKTYIDNKLAALVAGN